MHGLFCFASSTGRHRRVKVVIAKPRKFWGKLPSMPNRSILSLSLSNQASQCSNREDVTRGGKAKQCRGKAADSAALGAYMTNGSRFGGARLWNFVFVVPPGVRVRDHMLPRAPSAFYFLPSCCCCGIVVCPLHFFVIPPFLHPISERNVRL